MEWSTVLNASDTGVHLGILDLLSIYVGEETAFSDLDKTQNQQIELKLTFNHTWKIIN